MHQLERRARGKGTLGIAPCRLRRGQTDHSAHTLAADERIAHRLGLRMQLGRQRKVTDVVLDERAQLVRIPHRHLPRASRAAVPPRSPCSAPRAPSGRRAPSRPRRPARAARAPPASSRGERAAPLHEPTIPPRSRHSLPHDAPKDAVYEARRVVGGVALGQRDRFVDRNFIGYLVPVELVERNPEDVALDRAEAIGRPPFRRGGDPLVELGRSCRYGVGGLTSEPIDLAFVEGRQGLPRDAPLVEEEERGPTGCAAAAHAAPTAASRVSSRKLVEYSPLRNSGLSRISRATSRVVGIPRISSSPSARSERAIASSRVSSWTISLAIRES